jgi:hypothetical protein
MTPFVAEIDFEDVRMSWQKMSGATRDGLIVFGALVLVTLVVILWAAFIRKKKRRKHSHHSGTNYSRATLQPAEEGSKRRKWRKRRREHRPRNPTLAETGGLPPVRTDGPSQGPAA